MPLWANGRRVRAIVPRGDSKLKVECAVCGKTLVPGDKIIWTLHVMGTTCHADCYDKLPKEKKA